MTKKAKTFTHEQVNEHVAKKIRQIRLLSNLSLEQVGEQLDVPYQTIQKFESGQVLMSAGFLLCLANIYNVSVSEFFKGLENPKGEAELDALFENRYTFDLLSKYNNLPKQAQQHISQIVRALSKTYDELQAE